MIPLGQTGSRDAPTGIASSCRPNRDSAIRAQYRPRSKSSILFGANFFVACRSAGSTSNFSGISLDENTLTSSGQMCSNTTVPITLDYRSTHQHACVIWLIIFSSEETDRRSNSAIATRRDRKQICLATICLRATARAAMLRRLTGPLWEKPHQRGLTPTVS